jgi:hypothetical protein
MVEDQVVNLAGNIVAINLKPNELKVKFKGQGGEPLNLDADANMTSGKLECVQADFSGKNPVGDAIQVAAVSEQVGADSVVKIVRKSNIVTTEVTVVVADSHERLAEIMEVLYELLAVEKGAVRLTFGWSA